MQTATTPDAAPAERLPLRAMLAVAGLAAGLRLVWVLWAARVPTGLSDPVLYLDAGASIAEGRGYTSLLGEPTAYYPPGYPFFVGLLTWVADATGLDEHVVTVIGVAQALLGGVTAAVVLWIGWKLAAPWGTAAAKVTGVGAGVAVAVWPNLVIHSGLVLSETLFLALYAVLLAAVVAWSTGAFASRQVTLVVVMVASGALATWVRPQSVVLLVPAVAVAWLTMRVDRRRLVQGVAWLALGVMVAVVPWALRNAVVLDAFVPMSTNTGDNLCIGFNDRADGTFEISEECATDGRYVDGADVEVARDAELRDRAISWIVANPGSVPRLALQKLSATFVLDTDGVAAWESYGADRHLEDRSRSVARWLANAAWWLVAALGVGGTWLSWRDERTRLVAVVLLAAGATTVITPVFFFGDQRFKMPLVPVIAAMAGVAIAWLILMRREEKGMGQ